MALFHDLTALEAAAAVRSREVSPVELVEHALDRIARLDDRLGAFVTVTADAARRQAKEAEGTVLAADDPGTDASAHHEWQVVAEHVDLGLLPDGGHHFLRTRPHAAAEVVNRAAQLLPSR